MSWFIDVLTFHKKFGQTIGNDPGAPHASGQRSDAEEALLKFRMSLIEDELEELKVALEEGDRLEVADALCDLIYVTIGFGVALAMDLRPVWREVQRSNMEKDGGGKRGDGKILKPEGWKPPDVAYALATGAQDLHALKVEFVDED